MERLSNANDFEKTISNGLWLVDFSATWCGPCRMLEPNLEEVSKEFNVLQIDIDKYRELADSFNIMSVPSLFVFKDGKVIKQVVGYHTVDQLKDLMK